MLNRITRRTMSWKFANLAKYPADPILSINNMAKADPRPNKINVTIGAYRDEDDLPWILPSVRTSIDQIFDQDNNYNIEYLTLKGDLDYVDMATDLIYQYSERGRQIKKDKKVAQLQSLSGTGAVYFLLRFYKQCVNPDAVVYVPNPTWPIHFTILNTLNLKHSSVNYYNVEERKFDSEEAVQGLMSIPPKSLALLQVCGHNPTGHDLSLADWKRVIEVFKEKEIDVLIDNPYQGFVSGCVEKDSEAITAFVDSGLNIMIAQSFAKNFGLYSARIGAMSVVCETEAMARQVEDNLSFMIRNTTSTHPKFGSEIIKNILSDEILKEQWHQDLKTMANRMDLMRKMLVESLETNGSQHDWSYMNEQQGMFAFTHVNAEQVGRLMKEKSTYMIYSGRMSIAGMNKNNIDLLAKNLIDIVG